MPRFVVKASEVAAIIGKNPYKSPVEVRDEMWKKYFPATFKGETKADKAERALSASESAQKVLSDAAATETKSSTETENLFQKAKDQINSDSKLTAAQKTEVIDHLKTKVYTSHGIRSEDKTSDKVESEEKTRLIRDDAFYNIKVWGDFQIVGRVDRIEEKADGSRILIEIKNRTKRLFRKVPEYEYVQIQTYLQMLGLEQARHIEQFNNQVNSTDIARDDLYWEQEVKPPLEQFCKELYCLAAET
jgi:hypothetical protein